MKKLSTLISSIIMTALAGTSPIHAAPGTIAQTPLFLTPYPPPNILFALDDSGSMNSAIITPPGGPSVAFGLPPSNDAQWRYWCRAANLMAYDPAVTYRPWAAINPVTGTPFPDMTDIYHVIWWYPISGGIFPVDFDLSDAPVITGWHDADGDGVFDPGECPTSYSDPHVIKAKDLPPAERKNFANWFAYYSLRQFTLKSAATQVVANSSTRMGMVTLHHNNGVGQPIRDMTDPANKTMLLDDIIHIRPGGWTPLRTLLDRVGRYFDQTTPTPSQLNLGAAPSPILPKADGGECQQNFVILMTDGYWNGWLSSIGNEDGSVDFDKVYPAHHDGIADTLADVAMKWYKRDLAPSLAGKVPTQTGDPKSNLDENTEQHLVTFTVAFGLAGTLTNDPADRNSVFSWPSPFLWSNPEHKIDDLRHAAYNGRGRFLSAQNPQELVSTLEQFITAIEDRQGSAAAVSFNTTALSTNTLLFSATFNSTDWRGDLTAWNLDPLTGQLTTFNWQAAAKLDAYSDTDMTTNRVVYTWGEIDALGHKDGVLFQWSTVPPFPDTAIRNDLRQNSDGSTDTSPFTQTQSRLAFLLGDRSQEGLSFRQRGSRLGDIVHSSPHFVGPPVSGWPDSPPFGTAGAPYSAYVSAHVSTPREPVVYVGANDGMLHGFRVSDGEEVLAYLPGSTASASIDDGLHYLSELDYNHRYYVDGTPTSADVFIKTDPSGSPSWRTVLVGGLRGGGKGVFALDVTNPADFKRTPGAAEKIVLWEFTDQDDPNLGYTFSTPQIAMMNNGKWAVVIGNGYNATGSHTAQLFILYLEGGIDGQWSAGDYVVIDTGVGNPSDANGLSTPALVDVDGNGTIDRAYAGDLHGNLWAFDLSGTMSSDWKIAYVDGSGNPAPLFTSGKTRPITMKPLVLEPTWIGDTTVNQPNLMVYFGTGQYLTSADTTNTDSQRFYGIWDAGAPVSPSQLVEQTFIPLSDPKARTLTKNAVTYGDPPSSGDFGWYITLPDPGERVVVDAFEVENVIFFNTVVPQAQPCSAGGYSFLMSVDTKTGGTPDAPPFDYNGDDSLDDGDKIDGHVLAGEKFAHGVAAASAIINGNGKSYQYTSGTMSNKPSRRRILGNAIPTGKRIGWMEVIE